MFTYIIADFYFITIIIYFIVTMLAFQTTRTRKNKLCLPRGRTYLAPKRTS
jgi:hypothetical protein